MTTIVRDLDRPGSKMHKREVVEAATVVDTPPMVVVGVVGYVETPRGLRSLTTVWAEHLVKKSEEDSTRTGINPRRRPSPNTLVNTPLTPNKLKLNWPESRSTLLLSESWLTPKSKKTPLSQRKLTWLKSKSTVVPSPTKLTGPKNTLKKVSVDSVFEQDEMIDVIAVTKGHGFEGVTHRWGTKKCQERPTEV